MHYTHEVVIHDDEFVTEAGIHINGVENSWSVAKRIHGRRYGTRANFIHLHMAEMAARWNIGGGSTRHTAEFFVQILRSTAKHNGGNSTQ